MLYAVSVYERWEDGTWEFDGYVKVFYHFHKAMEYALEQTVASEEPKYFHVEPMHEKVVYAGGLGDLIVPLTKS